MTSFKKRSIYIAFFVSLALLCFAAAPSENISEQTQDVVPKIEITAAGKTYTYVDEHVQPSDFTVQEEIDARRINAPLSEKIELVDLCLSRGADHKRALSVCFPRLIRVVDGIAAKMYVQPKNAEVKCRGGSIKIEKEHNGVMLDESKLYASIYCCFKFSGGGSVTAYPKTVVPEVTADNLKPYTAFRGAYTTDYTMSIPARAHNVTLALEKIDGAMILPGETLSFNKTVGARTEKNGFKSAKIIVDGKYTDGVGGGVCQASTAVYNAALVAGLSCAANAHSICPAYCPPGLDAMISSVSDLLVTNPTTHPVYITVKAMGGKATVSVYGEKKEFDVVPESVTEKTLPFVTEEITDNELKYFDGEYKTGDRRLVSPGKDGISSSTYLNYYRNGKIVRRDLVRQNEYKMLPQVIAIAP